MPEVLTTPQAADFLKLAVSTVEKLRCHGGGPKFIKLGSRRVAYLKTDLDEWIASRPRCGSTSELPADLPCRLHRRTHRERQEGSPK
jgi:predicted DNA-binding transcriptional regulator AlpA